MRTFKTPIRKSDLYIQKMIEILSEQPKGATRSELMQAIFSEVAPKKINQTWVTKKLPYFNRLLSYARTGQWAKGVQYKIELDTTSTSSKKGEPKYILIPDPKNTYRELSVEIDEELRPSAYMIADLLKPFQSDPLADALLEQLERIGNPLGYDRENFQPIYCAKSIEDFEIEEVYTLVGEIARATESGKKIAFEYTRVDKPDGSIEQKEVYPLRTILYGGLHYLWTVDQLDSDKIVSYRLDRIEAESLEILDETFDNQKLQRKLKVNMLLNDVLGVTPPWKGLKKQEIQIRFNGWAANYVSIAKLHPSQKGKWVDKKNLIYDVWIKTYDTFELSFLLGRFRGKFCEIITPGIKNLFYKEV